MAVRVADKIKQFNDSDFFLMDAEDVEMSDGKSVEEKFAEKGKPNGYAGLDKDGKIPTEQLPPIAITETYVVNTQAQINARLPLKGGTMTGDIVMDKNKITSSAVPSEACDYTNKQYVDDAIANATMLECEITDSDGGTLLDSNGQPILGRINVINAITDINETIEKLKQHAILDSTF